MGASESVSVANSSDADEQDQEKEVYLDEGAFGVTYTKGDTIVKRLKYDPSGNDFKMEMTFYGWINSLPPAEQKHFCRLLEYKVYANSSFVHTPRNRNIGPFHKQMLEERNKSIWTVDFVLENKGRKVDPEKFHKLPQSTKYELLLQLLTIVGIMKRHHVFHEDIHLGNLLFDDKTRTLALIDYGVTALQGQRPVEIEDRNEMLVQVTSLMVNLPAAVAAFDIPVVLGPGETDFDRDRDFYNFLKNNIETVALYEYLEEFAAINKYQMTINGPDGTTEVHPTVYGVGDNMLRVYQPVLYLKMYKLRDKLAPPYFGTDDVREIFDNWTNFDRIVQYFHKKVLEHKALESKKK
jgi:serine/threonine protein kinase